MRDRSASVIRAATAVTAVVWVPWCTGTLLRAVGLETIGSKIRLLWHILFLPFGAVYHRPESTHVFTPLGATLLDVAAWLVVAIVFGFAARRLAPRWQLALAPLVVVSAGRLLVHGILWLGFNIDYDGP